METETKAASAISDAEAQMQERLAAYKQKLKKRKEGMALKDAEKAKRKEERRRRRDARAADLNKRFADDQAKAKAKLEERRRKREMRRKNTKHSRNFQRRVSKAMKDEHDKLADTENLVHQAEEAMIERFEAYEQKMLERKNLQVEEMVKERQRKEELQRQRQREAEEERKRTEEALAAIVAKTNRPITKAKSYRKAKAASKKPIWATPAFLASKQERRMKAFYEKQEAKKREAEERKLTQAKEEQREVQKARQEAKSRMEKELEEKRLATLLKEEEKAAAREVNKLMVEEAKTKSQSATKEVAARRAEWQERAHLIAERRANQEERARRATEERKNQELAVEEAMAKRRSAKRVDEDRLEVLQRQEFAVEAREEALARDMAREKAIKKQQEAIAAAAPYKKSRDENQEQEEEDSDSDDEDEDDWKDEEKAKFLADAQTEIAKQQQLADARRRKQETAIGLAKKAKEKEAARIAGLVRRGKRSLITDDTPDYLLCYEDNEDGAECSDKEIKEAVEDVKRIREAVAALQNRLYEVEDHEAGQIKKVQEKLKRAKYEFRDQATKGLVRYTQEEHDDLDRQVLESRQIIDTLRRENRKIRQNNTAMVHNRINLRKRNKTLKASIKYTKKVLMRGPTKEGGKFTGMNEDLEKDEMIWRKAATRMEEMAEMRALQIASLKRRRELREACIAKILGHFQNNCPNDVLVLKLGAMALGEDDEEVDRIVGPVRLVWEKPQDSDTEEETDSDSSDSEPESAGLEFNKYV
ncbi:expressed unknown protein [Seminavis robusta]|uniref:Uncharacterized protein n=1 Tax=Seminavis robusta TaxID=568900 RepID=A0A9N8HWY2_9STRA|nr:expressed unknown protein [Seminavis robusta]|eukprot:Sro2077_g313560.1 n/a (760) ;mRNA; f:2509-4788